MSDLDPDFQALVRKQYAGNPQAMTALGARLIVGKDAPQSPINGAALIEEAAQQGDAEAWSYIALLAAAGVGRPQSWADALDALGRSAELGESQALKQAQILRDVGIDDVPGLQAWLSGACGRDLSTAPRIKACADFLAPSISFHLIERAKPRLTRARVNDFYSGTLKIDSMRTNTGSVFSLIETDLVFQLVRARIAQTSTRPVESLEPLEILHYSVGERFKPHIDFYHPDLPKFEEVTRVKGQRVKTCLVYLNDDYDGGETEFPKIDLKFRGRAGEALFFDNVDAAGRGDMKTLHEGLPPSRGEKWLLSQWIRDKPQPVA